MNQADKSPKSDEKTEAESIDGTIGADIVSLSSVDDLAKKRMIDHDAETEGSHLVIQCLGCQRPMKVLIDTRLKELTCSVCGSHFSLEGREQDTRQAFALAAIGRFELIERLGMGQGGIVWKARDKELQRTVALKIPRQRGMTADEAERFIGEARAAAQLSHPHIIRVFEVGRDGEIIFIVSDYVRGVTLADWFSGRRWLSADDVVKLGLQITEALHYAHEHGVVHRDLKPANILIDGNGATYLMDFGLARWEVGEVTLTLDGQVLGTPAYMSPEQAEGRNAAADRRSDVYSVGVLLFQLLTGELPFRGSARMVLHQHIHDEPPQPRKLNPHIPKDLETISLKCLEKDPGKRYESAHVLHDDLQRFADGLPISAKPCTTLGRILRWYQRNGMAVVLTAGGYACILSVILLGWGLTGIVLLVAGAFEASTRMLIELLLLVFVFYPAIIFAGIATLKGRMWGVVAGLCIAASWTVATFLAALKVKWGILQLEVMAAANSDPFFHFQLTSLLLMLSGIGVLLHSAAFLEMVRMRLKGTRLYQSWPMKRAPRDDVGLGVAFSPRIGLPPCRTAPREEVRVVHEGRAGARGPSSGGAHLKLRLYLALKLIDRLLLRRNLSLKLPCRRLQPSIRLDEGIERVNHP